MRNDIKTNDKVTVDGQNGIGTVEHVDSMWGITVRYPDGRRVCDLPYHVHTTVKGSNNR